uniref:F-box domain-containing protein n=1 Tax=Steinernema glaseri TaxID=37863 RepID=A0A1I7ZZL9_9BILA
MRLPERTAEEDPDTDCMKWVARTMYDLDEEHARWRQFEVAPARANEDEDFAITGYQFRCLQQITGSNIVETMPFDYYCKLKYVRFNHVLFKSTSIGCVTGPLLEESYKDEELDYRDFPLYGEDILDGQGWLTDFPDAEEVSDILEKCTRDGCLLAMTEFEREVVDLMPLLEIVSDRVKKINIYKMRFAHIEDKEERKRLQTAFEDWLHDRIEKNSLESLCLDDVQFGNHKIHWMSLLKDLMKENKIPSIDIGFLGSRNVCALGMDFLEEHLKAMHDTTLPAKKECEYVYRIDADDLDVVNEEKEITESQEKFREVCLRAGFKDECGSSDMIKFRVEQDGWEACVRLYSFIVTVSCKSV